LNLYTNLKGTYMKNKHFLAGFLIALVCTAASAGSWVGSDWRGDATASAQGSSVTARIITRDVSFSKQVFITEGFDASDNSSSEFTLDSLENSIIAINNGFKSIKADFLESGYTIVLVDFDNNWSDLKRQGYALGNLFQTLWNLSPKAEPIKYIGLSMGGIIGSFACGLKQFYTLNPSYSKESWESPIYNAWNFKVNLCLTVDSPHSGAFIPGSIFNFVDFFRSSPDGSKAQQYYNSLVSTAACQMLIRKYGTYNTTDWSARYKNTLGAYKQTNAINLVGICNGAWAGKKQFDANNNVKIIDWHYDPRFCGESWTQLWSEPEDLLKKEIFWGKWGACYLFGAERHVWLQFTDENTMFENAPGGYANTYADVANSLPGTKPVPAYTSHCFVPTFSAAALDFNTYAPVNKRHLKLQEQITGQPMEAFSPMHKLYHQDYTNEWHVRGLALDKDLTNAILLEVKEKTVMFQQLYIIARYLN
jgi:hypothetical protein